MKKKSILLSAFATLAICVSLICGTTYALFTSESETSVAITSGKVDVKATLSIKELYSPTLINLDGTVSDATNAATTNFKSGGTATVVDGKAILNNLVPGDKATFSVVVTNSSSIKTKYRLVIKPSTSANDSSELFSALEFKIDGITLDKLESYHSNYTALEAVNAPTTLDPIDIDISLPAEAGNELSGLTTSVIIAVEAVQGNAATENSVIKASATTLKDINEIISLTPVGGTANITLTEDISQRFVFQKNINLNLDLNGHAITSNTHGIALQKHTSGSLTLSNGKVHTTGSNAALAYISGKANVTLNDIELEADKADAALLQGGGDVVFNNCKLTSKAYCAILAHPTATITSVANVTVNNCILEGVSGIETNADTKYGNVNLTIKDSTIISTGNKDNNFIAMFLPDEGSHTLLNNTVVGLTIACGGDLYIDGGTYSAKCFYDLTANEWNKDGNAFFDEAEAAAYYSEYTSGSYNLFDIITILDNRGSGYNLKSATIKNVTFSYEFVDDKDQLVFGVRYHNQNSGTPHDPIEVVLENNKTETVKGGSLGLYSVDYFNNN